MVARIKNGELCGGGYLKHNIVPKKTPPATKPLRTIECCTITRISFHTCTLHHHLSP